MKLCNVVKNVAVSISWQFLDDVEIFHCATILFKIQLKSTVQGLCADNVQVFQMQMNQLT